MNNEGRRQITHRKWTPDEDRMLAELYETQTITAISEAMGRGTSSIFNRVQKLGLKRSEEYKELSGSGRFKAGGSSWNKGVKGWNPGGKSDSTQFKPGRPSNTWRPIGAERLTKGTLYRKVSDTGNKRKDWKPQQVIAWEEIHGPLPDGMIVVHADRNKSNLAPENLIAISRSENMLRNSIDRYPPEYRQSAIALGWFKRKLRGFENEKSE